MTPSAVPPAPDFGREFEVVRPLGRGAVASVYLAREVALRRFVAIKVLDPELAKDVIARQRFEREAHAAARLSHRNIVAIHRVSTIDDGRPYLVMEYVDGRNLADALAAQTIDREAALQVLLQVASALSAAHEQNVVHRDVRLENIVWEPDPPRAVLTDFGIAAVLETGGEAVTRLTQAGEVLGDPRYSSPEQLLGESLTGRADVYSLAMVGYRLFSEEAPFDAKNKTGMIQAHLKAEPRRLSVLAEGIPKELDSLLIACLAKEPERRPDARDVVRRLQQIESRLRDNSSNTAGAAAPDATGHLLQGFFTELKQRRVVNVAAVYAASTYAVLQVGELILPELPLPEWTYTALVAVTLAGFPVALVLSWVFDLTDGGIRRTERSSSVSWGARGLRLLGLGLSLVLAVAIGFWILGL